MVIVDATTDMSPPRVRTTYCVAHDGVRLALGQYGATTAPTIVFAHGFGQTRHAWDDTALALAAQGWHCITADARGHGESGTPASGSYDYAQFIDDLTQIARDVTTTVQPILVGASMGGLIGLCAQALHAPLFR